MHKSLKSLLYAGMNGILMKRQCLMMVTINMTELFIRFVQIISQALREAVNTSNLSATILSAKNKGAVALTNENS